MKKRSLFSALCIFTASGLLANIASASVPVVVTEYTFASGLAASSAIPELSASSVRFGASFASSIGRSGSGNLFFLGGAGSTSDSNNGYISWSTSASEAVANNHYAEFTLTPQNDHILSVSNFTLKFGGSDNTGGGGIGAFTANVEIRSSLDNYQTVLKSQSYNVSAGANTSNTPATLTLSLSDQSLFQSITASSGVTFRIYVWAGNYTGDTAGTGQANSIRLDDFKVTGSLAAIPEPSSAIFGVAAVALLLTVGLRCRDARFSR